MYSNRCEPGADQKMFHLLFIFETSFGQKVVPYIYVSCNIWIV